MLSFTAAASGAGAVLVSIVTLCRAAEAVKAPAPPKPPFNLLLELSQPWVVCQHGPPGHALPWRHSPVVLRLFTPFLGGILGWMNVFHPGETAEEGLLVSHPQRGPWWNDGELIHIHSSWSYEPLPASLKLQISVFIPDMENRTLPQLPAGGSGVCEADCHRLMTLHGNAESPGTVLCC